MSDLINNNLPIKDDLIDNLLVIGPSSVERAMADDAAKTKAEIERKEFARQAAYKAEKLQQEREEFARQAAHKAEKLQQEREEFARQAAHKAEVLHEEERKKALIHYMDSSSKIDLQDLMRYADSLEQSEGAEETKISKGRTR